MSETELHTLNGTLDHMWKTLVEGVESPDALGRFITLATLGLDGYPQARTLVLRSANRDLAAVELFTDGATNKINELGAHPKASVLVWDRDLFQIRLSVDVEITQGPEEIWQTFRGTAPQNYGGTPTPGTPMAAAEDYIPSSEQSRFMVLNCTIQAIDTVYLGPDLHRRASFTRADGFKGTWIAP